jgi:hypothetical protein
MVDLAWTLREIGIRESLGVEGSEHSLPAVYILAFGESYQLGDIVWVNAHKLLDILWQRSAGVNESGGR